MESRARIDEDIARLRQARHERRERAREQLDLILSEVDPSEGD
jgi:hypothetical protein